MRKPVRTRQVGGDAAQITDFTQMLGLMSKKKKKKMRSKYFIPFKLGGPSPKMDICH